MPFLVRKPSSRPLVQFRTNSLVMSVSHQLSRFVDGQSPVYEQVLAELRRGSKKTHWMWFIFPQIEGLGQSPMARKYAINSKAEARAYLEHDVLGGRLRECVDILLGIDSLSPTQVFGQVDAMKLRSCLTLFAIVAPNDEERFIKALEKFYKGEKDSATIAILAFK